VGICQLLDDLPAAIVQRPGRIWNVLARSPGEQGGAGRTALAWRWALTGTCPSPVTLSPPDGTPPDRRGLLAEAEATAELARAGADSGGQIMHARFVLQWLAGERDGLPLWNGGPGNLHVTDGVPGLRERAEIDQVYEWAMLARLRFPSQGESAAPAVEHGYGWALGAMQLLAWVCGEAAEGRLSGLRVAGRPSLCPVSLDTRRAMTALLHARHDGQPAGAGRMEATMETFLWLAGWDPLPPVDRHGHNPSEECQERETPCDCAAAGRCVAAECAACQRVPCSYGFETTNSSAIAAQAPSDG
jgi:hypothetical protein